MVRQKAINSFQSILILELKLFSWGSNESKALFENFLEKAIDENALVSKAAVQCLISMAKIDDIHQLA